FGIATTFRSNGILNGLLLLEEAFRTLWSLKSGFRVASLRRLLAAGLGGLSVAVGFLLPQFIAYTEYCGNPDVISRPWCERTLPSIYTFVQDHYWYVLRAIERQNPDEFQELWFIPLLDFIESPTFLSCRSNVCHLDNFQSMGIDPYSRPLGSNS
ncbi:MAG: mannosyltransferase family protein, partial [Stellaceae bacterium]